MKHISLHAVTALIAVLILISAGAAAQKAPSYDEMDRILDEKIYSFESAGIRSLVCTISGSLVEEMTENGAPGEGLDSVNFYWSSPESFALQTGIGDVNADYFPVLANEVLPIVGLSFLFRIDEADTAASRGADGDGDDDDEEDSGVFLGMEDGMWKYHNFKEDLFVWVEPETYEPRKLADSRFEMNLKWEILSDKLVPTEVSMGDQDFTMRISLQNKKLPGTDAIVPMKGTVRVTDPGSITPHKYSLVFSDYRINEPIDPAIFSEFDDRSRELRTLYGSRNDFRLELPKGWSAPPRNQTDPMVDAFAVNGQDEQAASVLVYPLGNSSLTDFIEVRRWLIGTQFEFVGADNPKPAFLNGAAGTRQAYTLRSDEIELQARALYVERNGYAYELYMVSPRETGDLDKVFDELVSGFQFIGTPRPPTPDIQTLNIPHGRTTLKYNANQWFEPAQKIIDQENDFELLHEVGFASVFGKTEAEVFPLELFNIQAMMEEAGGELLGSRSGTIGDRDILEIRWRSYTTGVLFYYTTLIVGGDGATAYIHGFYPAETLAFAKPRLEDVLSSLRQNGRQAVWSSDRQNPPQPRRQKPNRFEI